MTRGQRRRLITSALLLLALIGLTAAWRWSPLGEWLAPAQAVGLLRGWGDAAGPMLAVPLLTVALVVAVPLSVLTLLSMAALGPWWGSACIVSAALLAAAVSQTLGRHLGHDLLLRWAGPKILSVSESLAARGLWAVVAIRLVPIAPFAIVNMAIGTTHLRLRDMVLGTLIGLLPMTVAMAIFTDWFVARLGD
ncbi:MAG: TVP38/TMEM64 family protein [Microbacteriaceae bacterium]|nr:TVP38/TMEM64 family protein [Burkholderiaceae bacterium]